MTNAMTRVRGVLEVARWEIRRHAKVREQVWTFVLTCLLLGGIAAVVRLAWPGGALGTPASDLLPGGALPSGGVPTASDDARTTRLATGVVVGFVQLFMLLGTFTGFLNAVAGITAEKRLRVTELVLSAIPPRTWMDGKLVGLAVVSLISALTVTSAGVAVLIALRLGGVAVPSLVGAAEWQLLALLVPVGVLGFLFWFTLFAAVAATMDDPNASSRHVLLFAPFVPAACCVPVAFAPQTPLATVLTLLPPTAPFVLLTRVAVTTVPAWEVCASVVLLALATLGLRVVAARVFALGVLMYGKDASWSEVRRWVAET